MSPGANLGGKLTQRLCGYTITRHYKLHYVIREHLLKRRLLVFAEGAAGALKGHVHQRAKVAEAPRAKLPRCAMALRQPCYGLVGATTRSQAQFGTLCTRTDCLYPTTWWCRCRIGATRHYTLLSACSISLRDPNVGAFRAYLLARFHAENVGYKVP